MTRKDTQVATIDETVNALTKPLTNFLEDLQSLDRKDGYLAANTVSQFCYAADGMAKFKRRNIADRVAELLTAVENGDARRVDRLETLIASMESELNDIERFLIPSLNAAHEIITGKQYEAPGEKRAPKKVDSKHAAELAKKYGVAS